MDFLKERFLNFIRNQLQTRVPDKEFPRDRLHSVTTTQNFYVIRDGLHGHQCYRSHMDDKKKVTKTHQ